MHQPPDNTCVRHGELTFLSHSCALFCTFLHSRKIQLIYFQALPHSLPKNTGAGGTPATLDRALASHGRSRSRRERCCTTDSLLLPSSAWFPAVPGRAVQPIRPHQPVQPIQTRRVVPVTKLRGAVVVLCTVLSFILFGVTFAPGARADQWDKKTIVTFNESVEIPGQVLPAGTYLFKLADSPSNRHIVQIWNADQNEILATIMTVPKTRFEAPDDSMFEFDERPSGSAPALKVWFYPGDTTGEEFVYSHYSSSKSYSNRQ